MSIPALLRNAARVAVCLVIPAMLLGACSSTASTTPTPSPDATASAPPGPVRVKVALSEFSLAAVPASVRAGRVTFVVQNDGAIPHEFVVVRSDLAPDRLPQIDQKLVDVARVAVVGNTGPFDSGQRREQALDLASGRYVLLCNVASHYVSGMFAAFTVSEAE